MSMEKFTSHHFGYAGTPELKDVAYRVKYEAIKTMLELESPNLHEIMLIARSGHTEVPPRISSLSTAVARSCRISTWHCQLLLRETEAILQRRPRSHLRD